MTYKQLKPNRKRAVRRFIIAVLNKKSNRSKYELPTFITKKGNIQKKQIGGLKVVDLFKIYSNVFGTDPVDDYINGRNLIDKPKDFNGKVYIIGSLESEVCKIGFSINPHKRIKEVQTGCPYELELLAMFIGNVDLERKLHKKYKQYRLKGEWFEIKGELKKSIQEIKQNPNNIL